MRSEKNTDRICESNVKLATTDRFPFILYNVTTKNAYNYTYSEQRSHFLSKKLILLHKKETIQRQPIFYLFFFSSSQSNALSLFSNNERKTFFDKLQTGS